jgi:hypothetical protein
LLLCDPIDLSGPFPNSAKFVHLLPCHPVQEIPFVGLRFHHRNEAELDGFLDKVAGTIESELFGFPSRVGLRSLQAADLLDRFHQELVRDHRPVLVKEVDQLLRDYSVAVLNFLTIFGPPKLIDEIFLPRQLDESYLVISGNDSIKASDVRESRHRRK